MTSENPIARECALPPLAPTLKADLQVPGGEATSTGTAASPNSTSTSTSTSTSGSTSTAPKYFAAHQYEYEVSPETTDNNLHNTKNSSSFSFDYGPDYDDDSDSDAGTFSDSKIKRNNRKIRRKMKLKKKKKTKMNNGGGCGIGRTKHCPSWVSTPLQSVASTAIETPLDQSKPKAKPKPKSTPYIITQTSLPMTKTIYLIRHAESNENRRQESLKTSVQGLGKLILPKKEDLVASMELMNVGAQLDTSVSPKGQHQLG